MIENIFPDGANQYLKENTTIISSPCRSCVKSDVCKYKDKINKDIDAVNSLLSNNDMLKGKITCKRMEWSNCGITYRGVENK